MSLKSPITASSTSTQAEPDVHANFNENLINLVVQNQALTAKSGSAVPNPLPKPPKLVQKIRDLKIPSGNDELLPGVTATSSIQINSNSDTEQSSVNNDYSSSANDGGELNKLSSESEFEIDNSNNFITNTSAASNVNNTPSSATTTPTNIKPTLNSSFSSHSISNLTSSTSASSLQQNLGNVNISHFKSSPNLIVRQPLPQPPVVTQQPSAVATNGAGNSASNSPLNEQKQALRNPKKYKSISTCEFKLESKLVYPPLPPVPHMVSSSLPPLPPIPPSAQSSSYLNTNSTPPLTLSSSLSSNSSMNNIESILLNTLSNSQTAGSVLSATVTTTTTTTTTQNIVVTSSPEQAIALDPQPFDSASSLSPPIKAHFFKIKYYTQPTRCRICEQFIWGVIGKQGMQCSDCGYPSHKHCIAKVPANCTSTLPIRKSRSANNASYEKEILKIQLDSLQSMQAQSSPTQEESNSNGASTVSPTKSKDKDPTSSPTSPVSPTSDSNKKMRRSSVDSALRDFQQSFKSLVSEDETLITYYSCGYQGSVLKHGRLYLTEHYLCFYDNLVFDKTKQRQKIVPISSIISIEKKSGLAPNGILIKTTERDYQFCLFLHRDDAFEVMQALMLYQEKQLLSESIIQKNVNGIKQALNQRKTRISVNTKSSKRSKSADGTVFSTLRTPVSYEDPPIVNVIKQNDIEMLNLLLEYYTQNKSDEINQPDKEGYSPLHVAVSTEISDSMMIHILKHPTIDVNLKNMDGNTPLHYFCQKFRSPECQKIVQMFVEKGANVNEQNTMGETPLHKAIFNHSVRLLMVYVLLKNGANINLVNKAGESALHYAVRLGRLDVLKTLITSGADPTLVSTKQNKTPLMLAEENNSPEIIDLLRRLEFLINSLSSSGLIQFRMALILEEISQEGALARIDDDMMVRIGCYEDDQRKQLFALKGKKFFGTVPAITPGAMDLLKELENMDIKNGKWIISQHELEYTDKIGSGVSGKVYKGLYRGREVAIKVLKSADEAHNREEFLKEFHVLASLQSNLIVGLYGVVLEPRICLVMEFCSKGSLYQVLHSEKMTWERFFSFSSQLLKGVDTLHKSEPQILHRDIKSLNFLVTRDWRIKVADFGLSRFNTVSNQLTLNKTRGTSAYCAPEVFQGKEYKEQSDIYSLGVVFWELIFALINGRYLHPYGEYKRMNAFQIMLCTSNHNLRPTIPLNCPESVKNLVSRCWDQDLLLRPTCTEAIELLAACETEFTLNQSTWNEILTMKDETSKHLSMDSSLSLSDASD